MSGEFTEEQSDFVDNQFFSNNQEKVLFFFEGDVSEIKSNASAFISFINNNFSLSSNLSLLENEDWRDSYKKYFTHAVVDQDLIVLPDWNANSVEFDNYSKK